MMMLRGGMPIIAARLRGWLTITATAFMFAFPASAQTPPASADAMMSAYREYQAAVERGDFTAAEPAAERAWRAAEASGAAPGRVGALALNLAITRAHLERGADVVGPARRALALAEAGAREVDPVLARLILGEALIASDFVEGERLITSALAEAQSEAYDASAHPAARALGREATLRKKYEIAKTAWEGAFRHAAGGRLGVPLSRAEALIGRGLALMGLRKDEEAYGLFVQAAAFAAPLAPEREDDVVTVGEDFYAHALAWSNAAAARMLSEDNRTVQGGVEWQRPSLPGRPPLCPVRLHITPWPPTYPREALDAYAVGAVIVRLSVSADGEVRSHRVLAAVPSEDFAEIVDNQRLTWTVTRMPDAPAGCRMETASTLVPVIFLP